MKRLFWGANLLLLLLFAVGCTSISNREGAEAYYNLGNAYFEQGKLQESKSAYQRALELDSSLSAATYNLARLYIEEKRYKEAENILNDLVTKDPENTILHETLGWMAFRQEQYDKALAQYRISVNLGEGNAAAWYNLGIINSRIERIDEAIDALEKAVYYAPEVLDYRLGLARLYAEQGAYAEASDYLYPLYANGGRETDLLLALAEFLVKAEDYTGALEIAESGLTSLAGRPATEAGEARAVLLFYKSFNLLVGFEDTAAGLQALREALDAGYDNREELKRFFAYPDLPGLNEVRRLLEDNGVAPQEEVEGDSAG